jgi:hypothetical protein
MNLSEDEFKMLICANFGEYSLENQVLHKIQVGLQRDRLQKSEAGGRSTSYAINNIAV